MYTFHTSYNVTARATYFVNLSELAVLKVGESTDCGGLQQLGKHPSTSMATMPDSSMKSMAAACGDLAMDVLV